MQKRRLVRIQGKLYLPLDAPVLELLGLGADTELSVTTDGMRLIVARAHATATARDAAEDPKTTVEVLTELRDSFEMTPKHFRALHHLPHASIPTHLAYCQDRQRFNGPSNVTVARRLIECIRVLRASRDWNEALKSALHLYPKETA
jgi:hypothetical protein